MTITPSTPASSSRIARHDGEVLRREAEASMSTGLCRVANGGKTVCSWARVSVGGAEPGVQVGGFQGIGGGDTGTARIGEHSDATPLRQRTPGQCPCPVELLFAAAGANHTGLSGKAALNAERCLLAGHRCGKLRRLLSAGKATCFERDHWFCLGDLAGLLHERTTVFHPEKISSRYSVITLVCGSWATGASISVSQMSAWLPRLSRREKPKP